jgi:multiple sugar transport system ATP-binding protein
MNLIDGIISNGTLRTGEASLPLPPGLNLADGRAVIYGIRPENLALGAAGLQGNVAVVEPTGSETHVVTRVDGHEVTAVFRDRVTLQPGDAITLAPEAAAAHIFDKDTGVRLN